MTRAELRAGLRRMAVIAAVTFAGTVLASLTIALLGGIPLRRAVSVGLYLAACGCLVLGLVQGIRPPVRPLRDEPDDHRHLGLSTLLGNRARGPIRWATIDERTDTILTASFLFGLGVLLLVVGTVVDGRRPVI